jgi:signal transduction histidine kinase
MKMKSSYGVRLWILITALLLVAAGMICALSFAWRRVQQLETKLTSSQLESFHLASEVRRELLSLNDSVRNYVLLRDSKEWADFAEASFKLDRWIDDHDPSLNPHSVLTTLSERQKFKELNRAYHNYQLSARAIHTNGQPALVNSAQLAQLDAFNDQAGKMRELVRDLANAHRLAEKDFLTTATANLLSLRNILIACVAMLLALVGALGWVLYRGLIAPLRTRLVHSQSLIEKQEKLVTLGTLAAGIAHEIRNPLTSLKARLYTLEKHLQNVPAAKKDTIIINSEISRLEHIVQDVLSFARPTEPKLETIAADAVLLDIQGLMSLNLKGMGVRLVVETSSELLTRADRAHLKQVIINLVRNAAEAIDGAGTVKLSARAALVQLSGTETEAVILEVADDGRGIPPEVEKRLFDPFFSTKETGTGLGLAIAARIIEKQGGMLQYQTRPGRGTTFGVVLPREINKPASC